MNNHWRVFLIEFEIYIFFRVSHLYFMLWRVIDIGGAYFDNMEMSLNDETKT